MAASNRTDAVTLQRHSDRHQLDPGVQGTRATAQADSGRVAIPEVPASGPLRKCGPVPSLGRIERPAARLRLRASS